MPEAEQAKRRGEKFVEVEERPGEEFDYLHLRIPVPRQVMPPETQEHVRAAVREVMLAFRSLLDEAIKRTEPKQPRKGKTASEEKTA